MSTDPRAALALARLLGVIVHLDADQLGDLVSMAEEMAAAAPLTGEPDPDGDPREATRRDRAEGEAEIAGETPAVIEPPEAAPPIDRAAEARLVIAAQRRLEEQRAAAGLTAEGLRPPSRASTGRRGDPQVARNVLRLAFKEVH